MKSQNVETLLLNWLQLNPSNTDTEGTEQSVRIRKQSVCIREVTTMTSLLWLFITALTVLSVQ